MKLNIVLGLMNIGIAFLIILVSLPLIKRKIKMNGFYGVRIKKSYESEKNWYNINAYGGKQLTFWSIPLIIAGIVCFFIPIIDTNQILVQIVMGVLPISICIIIALARIKAYAKKL
jgi:hypothetical protein